MPMSRRSKKRGATSARRLRREEREAKLRFDLLEKRLLLASDFGDAPLPFPTTVVESGAEHVTTGTLWLGATVDAEPDGTHSASADADGADDDGVTFGDVMAGALGATVTVNVQGASGKLDAWIDFNGDGNWGGHGEHIFISRDVSLGDNLLTFDVPSTAIAGTTFARFRLSTSGGLGIAGLAADGEVEDYALTILSPTAATGFFPNHHTISTTATEATDLVAVDLDSDGDMDVLSADGNNISWYENSGSGSFATHIIPAGTGSRPQSISVADMDGDGDLDLVSVSVDGNLALYFNDGNQSFTSNPLDLFPDLRSLVTVDLDGDGDQDVLFAARNYDAILWGENQNQVYYIYNVNTPDPDGPDTGANGDADRPLTVIAVDVDRDGDLDVLSASRLDNKIAWYENDGNQNFTQRIITTAAADAYSVFATDVDGDGDMDVLSAARSNGRVVWYENDGNQDFSSHTIADSLTVSGAVSVFAADIDGDGDVDVLSASRYDDKVAWYINDGSQNFTPRTISTEADFPIDVIAADVDGDGDLDVLSASHDDHTIAWYEILLLTEFGDAPLPYPTTRAENGAVHLPIGPMLGSHRDAEVDGTHSNTADFDDFDGVLNDEDGVAFGSILVVESTATVTVNVQGAEGKLDAWIDFNGNGSWDDPGDQIFVSRNVAVGDNQLTFSVPSGLVAKTTYARFRLSTAGGLLPTGIAPPDGEVEDYQVAARGSNVDRCHRCCRNL